jgi:hypothetical protein
MNLFNGLPERPRVVVCGALRLARTLPILRVVETPFVSDLEAIVLDCEARDSDRVSRWIDTLSYWRAELAESHDVLLPSYYQAIAVSVGMSIVGIEDGEPLGVLSRINANIGNFWNCCDHLVHRVDGFRDGRLSGLKTTLRGVEDLWFRRDLELLSGPDEPHNVLLGRLGEIEAKSEMRKSIARVVANCAQWG